MLTPRKVEDLIPGVQRRLNVDGAELLFARSRGTTAGFTLYGPNEDELEIFYLAVHPNVWGEGVGSQLLLAVEKRAGEMQRKMLELWVIHDNERAISFYQRNGFVSTDLTKQDSTSERVERRLVKRL